MYTHEARTFEARARPPRRKQKGQGCKQEDASLQKAMFSRSRGLAPLERSSLSLSLSLFSRACIRGSPSMYPLYFSCFLLGPRSLGMAMSVLHFLYLAAPFPWNVGNVWFTFSLCVIALCMMHVYIYMPTLVWVIVHFVWWTLMAMWATLSSHKSS